MLTDQNALLIQTGPGTPGGELFRRYWQPAALSRELPPGGAPLPIRLLGEDLVLFRDEQGQIGLLGLHCSHRGADLSYGRLEDGGLRCIYHGWLYDLHGRCLDQPGELPTSVFKDKIQHPAYPCQEVAGITFAYLGSEPAPLLPAYDLLLAPGEYRWEPTKSLNECNYLQGNEGNYDPIHTSLLHRLGPDRLDEAANGHWDLTAARGTIDVEETDYGLRIYTFRPASPDSIALKITNFVMPNLCVIKGANRDGYQIDWHVPIDDEHHWKYTMQFQQSRPVDPQVKERVRGDAIGDGFQRVRTRANRYLQDRDEMRARTFAGIGSNFLDHDACVIEIMGVIQDRTQEQLGYTDRAIVMARLQLLKAIHDVQQGRDPLHVVRDPERNHFSHLFAVAMQILPASADWRTYWREPVAGQASGSALRAGDA